MRGGRVRGEVLVLVRAPALKVRPKGNIMAAVTGEGAPQTQIGGRGDKNRERQLGTNHPPGGGNTFKQYAHSRLNSDRASTERPPMPEVTPIRSRTPFPQRRSL